MAATTSLALGDLAEPRCSSAEAVPAARALTKELAAVGVRTRSWPWRAVVHVLGGQAGSSSWMLCGSLLPPRVAVAVTGLDESRAMRWNRTPS